MQDGTETPFQMSNAREAISHGLTHIQQQVLATEDAVFEQPRLAFDLAKALIESACRTILKERAISYRRKDALPVLFNKVRENLSFLPPEASQETDARRSLKQTLGGLYSAVQGICELRNQYSFASHGYEEDRPSMEKAQAMLVAGAADAIIGFLYTIHVSDRTVTATTNQSLYEVNSDFNDFIDETHDIFTILDAQFLPSEILFQMEPATYKLRLVEFQAEMEGI